MEKLIIYQKALDLVVEVYALTNLSQTYTRDFSLQDQIKRAAISVLANIADGYSRSLKVNKNYLKIASGSANEVVALLQIIQRIYQIDTLSLQDEYRHLGRQINAFSNKLKSPLDKTEIRKLTTDC